MSSFTHTLLTAGGVQGPTMIKDVYELLRHKPDPYNGQERRKHTIVFTHSASVCGERHQTKHMTFSSVLVWFFRYRSGFGFVLGE